MFGEADPMMSFEDHLSGATRSFWDRFVEARRDVLSETRAELGRLANLYPHHDRLSAAFYALGAAERQLDDTITPDLCLHFLDAWRADLSDWQAFSNRVNNVGSTREAMDFLELKTWRMAEFGDTT